MKDGVSVTEGEMKAWGRSIGAQARPPFFLGLEGPLGAGKSVLARSIARGAGVSGPVPSPTYTLVRRYDLADGRRLVHMDLYRLSDPDEVLDLGWEDFLDDTEALLVVEWAGRAGPHLPEDRWRVRLSPIPESPDRRHLERRSWGSPPLLPPLWRRDPG